jgi:RHS repeat-associated protein
VLGKDAAGRFVVGDPTFGEDILVSGRTLDEESSGYFLVPPGELPQGWRAVDATEGNAVWGRGDTGSNHDNGATGAQERHALPCPAGGGCSTWNVEAMVDGLSLHDDPIGYTPPVGPAIRFPMDYSHRDTQQPMHAFTYTNFGNKWTSGWLSYVIDGAGCDGFYGSVSLSIIIPGGAVFGQNPPTDCALLYRRGGGSEPYVIAPPPFHSGPTGLQEEDSALGQFSQAILTKLVDPNTFATVGFVRTLSDGAVEKFMLAASTTQFFMTEVDDPQGNAVKIAYDQSMRIVALTDAIGQVTTICYNDSWQTTTQCQVPAATSNPPSNLQVTQVVDPFGRSAYFGYDPLALAAGGTGHLTSITDVLGITSSFLYQTGTDFISQLTTPYGTTQFAFTGAVNPLPTDTDSDRSVTITDPLGRVSRVEFHQGSANCSATGATGDAQTVDANSIACSETLVPVGMSTENDYLQYRNTFVWDPYQYQLAFTNPQPGSSPYSYAEIIHWLHTNDQNRKTASRTPESIKKPLERRTWFNYVNQDDNAFGSLASIAIGSTNQPTYVGRVLDDGTTQLWQYRYNPYGNISRVTDPVGRQLTFVYAMNGIDLLTVTNTTPSAGTTHSDLLATYSNYNAQHEPQTSVAANGQASSYTYNAAGQLAISTDPLNNTWTLKYDPPDGGYLKTITGPAAPQAPVYGLTYDGFGRVYTFTDPSGETLTNNYDAANRLRRTLYPDQTTERFDYDRLDLTVVTDRRGNTINRHYDAARQLYEIDESARNTLVGYWPNGFVETVQDPRGFVTTYLRDVQGRLRTVQYPDNTSVTYMYDSASRLASFARAAGSVVYTYNPDDTLDEVKPVSAIASSPAPLPTFFDYDPAYKRLTGWLQATARPTATNGVTPSDAEILTYYPVTSPPTLNANQLWDDIVAAPDATGLSIGPPTSISYTYDELDRVVSRKVTPATAVGQLQPQVESWQYDALGRVFADDNALDSFTYDYADATPRVTGRTSLEGPQLAMGYHPPQQDGLLEHVTYATLGGALLAQFVYQYDPNANVTRFTETYPTTGPRSTSYVYDAYNQLQLAAPLSTPGATQYGYGYDPGGNIAATEALSLSPVGASLSLTATAHNNSNEITTTSSISTAAPPSSAAATYDSDGNLHFAGSSTYTYDVLGRLTQITSPNGKGTTSLVYDGLGRIAQIVDKVAGGVVANHIYGWCGAARCIEYDDLQRDPSSRVTPLADKLYFSQGVVQYTYSTTNPPVTLPTYYVTDLLGSVRALVRSFFQDAVVVTQYEYEPYGNRTRVAGGGPESDVGFAGYFHHAPSGLDFALNRAYSGELSRWLTRDPIGNGLAFAEGPGFNATALNLYAYAGNNPASLTDPSGNCPQCLIAAAGAVIGGAGFGIAYAFTAPTNLTGWQFASGLANAVGQGAYIGALAAVTAGLAVEIAPAALAAVGIGGAAAASNGEVECEVEQAQVTANREAGNAFRDRLAAALQSAGRDVQTEVYKRTLFGARWIDIEVSQNGRVLGGIEAKLRDSPYTPDQRAKDAWLWLTQGYRVDLVREPNE